MHLVHWAMSLQRCRVQALRLEVVRRCRLARRQSIHLMILNLLIWRKESLVVGVAGCASVHVFDACIRARNLGEVGTVGDRCCCQSLTRDRSRMVAVEPAHVVGRALLVRAAAECVPVLVDASALLAQGGRERALGRRSATHHAADPWVWTVVRGVEGDAFLGIVEGNDLSRVHAPLELASRVARMLGAHHRGAGEY